MLELQRFGVAPGLAGLQRSVRGLLAPETVLDILANFTLFATDKKKRRLKEVCRYQQYEGANRIVERVVARQPKSGLIWHFQANSPCLAPICDPSLGEQCRHFR